jgi:3-oxoacyl-[acyl-carrier-protein] synthase I
VSTPGAWICSIGVVTPVGGTALQTATSIWAGISRFAMSGDGDGPIVASLPEDWLPALSDELVEADLLNETEQRLLRLAVPAMAECLDGFEPTGPVPLLLGVPDATLDAEPDATEALFEALELECGIQLDRGSSRILAAGRAAGIAALADAARLLAAGHEYVIAGGVDSYLAGDVLSLMADEDRIAVEGALDFFIPGEGAGFLLLGNAAAVARRQDRPPLGYLHPPALADEPGHRYSDAPSRGDGLTAAVAGALVWTTMPVPTVLCSLNGESENAKEWGIAALRNSARIPESARIVHPADCLGDAGAGAAPLLIALAVLGLARGRYTAPVLVWCASDTALRGAVTVTLSAE